MSLERSRKAAAMVARLAAATLLLTAAIGSAAAQTGTITFLGAITNPSCGFRPSAGLVQASCHQPSGQIVSAPFAVAPHQPAGPTRIGVARLELQPARAGKPSAVPAYLVVVTYH
ncbi:hypothetical protein VSR17_19810 [Cupriavidus taiwanensis]|uniref:Lipoprotein n=1 Tax=Cupriavidus taiwanensis TaxID=164546 RepID=A0A375IL81_9BURK|nr:hypothetical protein [Cupriavidus taiwanensis]SOY72694.1 conserved exported hypothetical protein [Cupriavidus taiwanensis]SOY72887.1 conserved exported hypothetical protein [Cupriavidus taiwanensis]SOY96846.1 conserved exported hypothetical protein [Cupriavidus taiwanensis]SOZ30808.1 conserved exported hypothetical protein [Cupriavidus taiwanensis]SOZ66769.1 conserved exported hypothetical protein [Cupriavidus taiwanensis]